MTHADVQRQMADYLEGDLPLPRRALFDAHLDGCDECRHEIDAMRRTVALLRDLPDPEPPPTFAADVMRRVRTGEGQAPWWSRAAAFLTDTLLPRIAVPATAVAAGLAVAVVSGEIDLTLPGVDFNVGGQPVTHEAAAERLRAAPPPVTSKAAAGPVERVAGLLTPPSRSVRVPLTPSAVPRPRLELRTDLSHFQLRTGTRQRESHGISVLGSGAPTPPTALASAGTALTTSERTPPVMIDLDRRSFRSPTRGFAAASATGGDTDGGLTEAGSTRDRQVSTLDPRIELLVQQPQAFEKYFAAQSGAARDLWVASLAQRIVERGLQDEVQQALRRTGDPMLAERFARALDEALERAEVGGTP